MSLPPEPPGPPDQPDDGEALPEEFFPPMSRDGKHSGIDKELRDTRFIEPKNTNAPDYRWNYARGFIHARDFLLRLPRQPEKFGPQRIKLVHRLLFSRLYRDPGLWRATQVTFGGGRIGADTIAIDPELELLEKQSTQIASGWRNDEKCDEGVLERLLFIAFFHARLVFAHPFRDGNGRTARLIAQWQEWCCFGPSARNPVPRGVYISALEALPTDFTPLVNFFCYRHPSRLRYLETCPSPFPVKVTIRPER